MRTGEIDDYAMGDWRKVIHREPVQRRLTMRFTPSLSSQGGLHSRGSQYFISSRPGSNARCTLSMPSTTSSPICSIDLFLRLIHSFPLPFALLRPLR